MSRSYHGTPAGKQHPLAKHPEWLLIAYCHARAAGLPAGSADQFCTQHLAFASLADRLTTEVVLFTLLFPRQEPLA